MSYQFMHVELYAPKASKLSGVKRTKKGVVREGDGIRKNWSARQILAEALREPDAHDHVQVPQPPEALLGNLQELADRLDAFVKPKSQRSDSPVLMAGVVSAPWPAGDERSAPWRADTVQQLKKEHGANLEVVIAHNDESYDHLHFYVCTRDFLPIKPIAHAGYKARQAAEAAGEPPKVCAEAYEGAMKGLQDRYFLAVAQAHGMARTGPKRRRLGRMEWIEEKRLQELHALGVTKLKKQVEENQAVTADLAIKSQVQKTQKSRLVDATKQLADEALKLGAREVQQNAREVQQNARDIRQDERESKFERVVKYWKEQKNSLSIAFGEAFASGSDATRKILLKCAHVFGDKEPEPVQPTLVAPVVVQGVQLPIAQIKRAPRPS